MPPKARPELDACDGFGSPRPGFYNCPGWLAVPRVYRIPALVAERKSKRFAGAIVPRAFYDRDPRLVGPDLLGKLLVRRHHSRLLVGRIVEVEAYLGSDDPAAHAYAGRTARNAVLFGPPGYAYVYFIYGNHYCLNVSCLPDGTPGGILFRALEPVEGIEEMFRLRAIGAPADLRRLTSGPGRLAAALAITRQRDNGKDLTARESDLYIAEDGSPPPRVLMTKRVGISRATEMPLRYIVAGNYFVSGKAIWP